MNKLSGKIMTCQCRRKAVDIFQIVNKYYVGRR